MIEDLSCLCGKNWVYKGANRSRSVAGSREIQPERARRARFFHFWAGYPGRQFRGNLRERARRSPGIDPQESDPPLPFAWQRAKADPAAGTSPRRRVKADPAAGTSPRRRVKAPGPGGGLPAGSAGLGSGGAKRPSSYARVAGSAFCAYPKQQINYDVCCLAFSAEKRDVCSAGRKTGRRRGREKPPGKGATP